jgi:hypothetical protein
LFICLWQRSSHKRIEKIIKRLLLYNNKFELEQPAEQYAEILTHIQNDLNECKRKTDELEILREKLTQIQDDLNKYKRIDEPEEIRIEENTGNGTPDTDANSNTETIQSVADNSSGIQYVKLKQNDGFYQLSSESGGCDFKIFNIRGNTADFEFCGNKSNALAKQYIFDNVCEIVYRSAAPKDIVNVEKGMVTMTESGNWKVTNRAKIRFE